jgi:hypothetical protein
MKNEVYSWRVSTDLKTGLELEARRRKTSLSAVLDVAARDWLSRAGSEVDGDERQLRLQQAAMKCFGAFAGGIATRSEDARQAVRRRLRRRHAR